MAVTDLLIPVSAALTLALIVWGVYSLVAAPQATVRERLTTYPGVAAPTAEASRGGLPFKDRALSDVAFFDRFLRGRGYAQRVELELARAAIPMRVGEYLLLRWLLAALLFLAATWFGVAWFIGLALAVLGYLAPRYYVSHRESKRIRAVEDQLVDALTMMANALKSGASFLQAMELVAAELPPPISQEFAQVVAEVGVGAPIDQALTELSERVRSYDLYLIITAIIVQRRVGGNLAEVLGNIAHTVRERQQMLRQAMVETSEMRLSAYVLIALPVFMLIYLAVTNPNYIQPLLFEPDGRLLLAAAAVMQVIGFLIMRRIADVKV